MKKPNYILLALIALAFAYSVVSMAEETSVSPSQKLKENIEKYAKEKEISNPLKAQWEYHEKTPKEEWLPVWKEILLNGTLAESVTNWLNFAKVPLFFLCQVDNPTWPDDSHFLNIATDFKKLCETPDHFTLDDFSEALLKMKTDDDCCYPLCYAYLFFPKDQHKEWMSRKSYHPKNIGDVMKFLGLRNALEKILLDKIEELKKGDYREFRGSTLAEQTLGDITTFGSYGTIKLVKNDIINKWWALFDFAYSRGLYDLFMKELEGVAIAQSNCFFLTKFYCERLNDREKAVEFLNKHFNVDKICTFTEAYPEYAGFSRVEYVRSLASIIGAEELTDTDKAYMRFGEEFENTFVRQSFSEDRSIRDTLRIGWELMSILPERELTRVSREEIEKYLPKK